MNDRLGNRITHPQPTIFDVTATDYVKLGRQPQQTVHAALSWQSLVKMVHFYAKISDNRPNNRQFVVGNRNQLFEIPNQTKPQLTNQ